MQPTIKDLFDKIQNVEVQTEPFDHLVVDNLLPDDFFKELSKELEDEDFPSNYQRGSYGGKDRFGVDITDYHSFRNSRRAVSPTKVHPVNYNKLLDRNLSHVGLFVKLLLENHKDFYSLLCFKFPTEKIQDNYFFHVSMVKDRVDYKVEPHTDDEQNIFTILFYAPETDVNKEFGLHVYKDRGTATVRRLENGETIDFIPNRMIIFVPSKPNKEKPPTWHEVRRLSDKLVGTRNSFQMFFLKNHSKLMYCLKDE